jgi:hypothetical protein
LGVAHTTVQGDFGTECAGKWHRVRHRPRRAARARRRLDDGYLQGGGNSSIAGSSTDAVEISRRASASASACDGAPGGFPPPASRFSSVFWVELGGFPPRRSSAHHGRSPCPTRGVGVPPSPRRSCSAMRRARGGHRAWEEFRRSFLGAFRHRPLERVSVRRPPRPRLRGDPLPVRRQHALAPALQ